MITIKWFTGLNMKEELKQRYRERAKQYRLDINRDVSDDSMKEINAEATEKEEQVALPNTVVIHLVRNRNYNVQVDGQENRSGRHRHNHGTV